MMRGGRLLIAREITIVAYHDIADGADPLTRQLSLSTRPEAFRDHVNYFAKNFDLIGEEDLLAGKLPRKPLLITFDDAYRSVLTVAVPVLQEVNSPAVFFVVPSLVQGSRLPVDNVLSLAAEQIGIPRLSKIVGHLGSSQASVPDMISKTISRMSLKEIADIKRRILDMLGTTEAAVRKDSPIFLNPEDVRTLTASKVSIGNHSMSHCHFRNLSADEINVEIVESRLALEQLSGRTVRSLSVPYGDERDATKRVVETAYAHKHEAIFLVQARSNRFRRPGDCYYRVSLRNETPLELTAALRVYPMLRSVVRGVAGRVN
jgi:peptidoglycan/xylan/chitin deacetylase (PgdA/CDA1 family)